MKLSLYILFFLSLFTSAQEAIEVKFVKKTPLNVDALVGIDNFESLYFINNNVLHKKTKNTSINYNNVQLGEITSVDTFGPLKFNIFYKGFNTVIILDNRLSEIFKIDFSKLQPYKNITHVSTGNENTLWIFNQDSQQLENYDYKAGKTRVQTMPIQGEILDLKSNYNFCWLLTKTHIYTYNYFGSLLSKLANNGYTSIKENNGNLFLLKQNSLSFIANGSDAIQNILIPNLLIKQFLVTNETLYIYDNEFLHQYQLKMN